MRGIHGHVKRFAADATARGRRRAGRDVPGLGVDGAVRRPRPQRGHPRAGAGGGRRARLPPRPDGQPARPAPDPPGRGADAGEQPLPRRAGRGPPRGRRGPRLRRRPEHGDPHPRRAPGHRDAGRLPLRGPRPPRPGRPRRPARRPGAAAAGGGDRPPGRRGRGRRGPYGRRRGGRPGRRPPGQPSDTARSPMSTGAGGRSPPTAAAATARPCAATAWPARSRSSPATTPRRPAAGRRGRCSTAATLPGAVVAYNDSCALGLLDALQPGRGRASPRRSRWPATTTAAWPGSPT